MKSMLDDLSFATCGVCGGENDSGFGYTPGGLSAKTPIMWTCKECLPVAAHVYGAARMHRKRYEQQARDDALVALAETLMSFEKTDFMDLEQEEARAIFDAALKAYQDSLREALKNHASPF